MESNNVTLPKRQLRQSKVTLSTRNPQLSCIQYPMSSVLTFKGVPNAGRIKERQPARQTGLTLSYSWEIGFIKIAITVTKQRYNNGDTL